MILGSMYLGMPLAIFGFLVLLPRGRPALIGVPVLKMLGL